MEAFVLALRTKAWRTAGARYNASRRLRRREQMATISLAFFSSISVAIAFVQRIYVPASSPLDNYLVALSGCLGIFLLAISLIEGGAGNGLKANALYKNAEDLNGFQTALNIQIEKLKTGSSLTWQEIGSLAERYQTIKEQCPYNHEPIDDSYFQAQHLYAPEFYTSNENPCFKMFKSWWNVLRWHSSWAGYFKYLWIVILGTISAAYFFV